MSLKDQVSVTHAKDMDTLEFVRLYAMRIYNIDALKYGLIVAEDASQLENALRGISFGQQERAQAIIECLLRVGFLCKTPDAGEQDE
jgi:hypothetical protein